MASILSQDLQYTLSKLTDREQEKLCDSVILLTGCAGFLGYYLLHFFRRTRTKAAHQESDRIRQFHVWNPKLDAKFP